MSTLQKDREEKLTRNVPRGHIIFACPSCCYSDNLKVFLNWHYDQNTPDRHCPHCSWKGVRSQLKVEGAKYLEDN